MRNQIIIQAVGELFIPILGFYWWEWDLHFILLFYYLDVLASLVLFIVKAGKVNTYRTGKQLTIQNYRPYLTNYFFVLVGLIGFEMGTLLVYKDMNLMASLLDFLTYKELGIPQGIILLPLIVLMNYQNYKLTFLMNGTFRFFTVSSLSVIARWVFVLFAVAGIVFLGVNVWLSIPDQVWLWILVAGKLGFDLYLYPKLENKVLRNQV
ncbi:hypothetical protein GCM10009118_06390 [Wandonia haliotis]|uniref:Uncharacterized protein n=1 Tax=Wandonia haliotis TaxID=574963 RepID=A0ABN1MLT1_9FLAO